MPYTKEQKRKIFDSLPGDLQEAILSVDTADKLDVIREKHSLMLDQAGELGDELGLFMLGITRQKDFISNLSTRLQISNEKAGEIAADINTSILNAVRDSLQKIQERSEEKRATAIEATPLSTPPPPSNPPEKVGNINIIRRPASSSPQYNDSKLDKDAVLHDLENIEKLKPQNAPNFVEHLLGNPVQSPAQTEVKKPTPPPQPQKKYETDPYREQI